MKENAHYYANSNDVKSLLKDIENLGRNNREKFIQGNLNEIREEYSWDKLVDRHEKYFMSLLAHKR